MHSFELALLHNNCLAILLKCRIKNFGKVLMIDEAVWDAELDEFSYQKMMNVLPIKSHPNESKFPNSMKVSFISCYLNKVAL